MAVKKGGHVGFEAKLPLRKVEGLSVKQLKGKLSSAGVENAGITDRAVLAKMVVERELV